MSGEGRIEIGEAGEEHGVERAGEGDNKSGGEGDGDVAFGGVDEKGFLDS